MTSSTMTPGEKTPEQLKAGVKLATGQRANLQVAAAAVDVLIGGPYKTQLGEVHSYGHAALRVVTSSSQKIYDFGRYGNVTGQFGAEGEGILRVWDDFDAYMASENAYGRTTKRFSYAVSADLADKVIAHYSAMTAQGTIRRAKHPHMQEFKLSKDYNAIDNNCATTTLSGARIALPGIDADEAPYNQGRGMSGAEKVAARAKNFGMWPSKIFMPADVQEMLEKNKKYVPKEIKIYGPGLK